MRPNTESSGARLRVLVGVDTEYADKAASLLKALQFPLGEVVLLNVVESLLPDGKFPNLGENHPLTVLTRTNEKAGQAALTRIAEQLTSDSIVKEQHRGSPAKVLIECAEGHRSDLIAVGSGQRGKWGSLFFGSVTKALAAEAPQSILIGKQPVPSDKPLRVVVATDHSPYADRCIKRLLDWAPAGISDVLVVTATGGSDLPVETNEGAEAKSRDICADFERAGIQAEALLRPQEPQELISKAVKDFGADLLVVGARGHGFWQRLWLGSVAHFHVVATPHNVLVIRS